MDAIQRFNKQTSSARVFFYRKLSQCTMNCVHMLVNSRLYDAIHAFRVCFLDDVTITESTGIISSIFKYVKRHVYARVVFQLQKNTWAKVV